MHATVKNKMTEREREGKKDQLCIGRVNVYAESTHMLCFVFTIFQTDPGGKLYQEFTAVMVSNLHSKNRNMSVRVTSKLPGGTLENIPPIKLKSTFAFCNMSYNIANSTILRKATS